MILLQAVPPPPPVPPIPLDPNLVLTSLNPAAVVMIVVAVVAAATLVLWPLARALARRLEGKHPTPPALQQELEQVQQRLGEVDSLHARVAELEERLDFAERLLARGDTAPQVPRAGG
jgi:hypothetical protein